MLISNSTPLSNTAIAPEMPNDGINIDLVSAQEGGDLNGLPINNKSEQSTPDNEFFSLFNQHQLQLNKEKSIQAAENEVTAVTAGVSTILDVTVNTDLDGKIEFSLSSTSAAVFAEQKLLTENDQKLSLDWSSNILSPVSESEEILFNESEGDLNSTLSEVVAVAIMPADSANLSVSKVGDKLPPSRQPVSAGVPALAVSLSNSVIQEKNIEPAVAGVKSVDSDVLASAANVLNPATGKMSESELQSMSAEKQLTEKLELEKFALKKPVQQEQAILAGKENQANILSHTIPLSVNAAQNSLTQPLATALPTLQLSPQAPATQWGQALGERVSLALNKRLNSAEIRLDPPHLGKLDIQIQIKDDSATVTIHTQHAQTRELIESASVRLREFLQDAGYSAVNVDVSHRDQTMAGDDFFQQGDGQNDGNTQQQNASQHELTDSQHSEMYLNIEDGRIDYFA